MGKASQPSRRKGGFRPSGRARREAQRGASRSGVAGVWGPGASAGLPLAFGPPQAACVGFPAASPPAAERAAPGERERERAPERGVAPASRSRSPLARPPSAAGGSRSPPSARAPVPEGGSAPAARRARLRLPRGEPGARRRKQLRSGPRSFPARGRSAGPPRGPGAPLPRESRPPRRAATVRPGGRRRRPGREGLKERRERNEARWRDGERERESERARERAVGGGPGPPGGAPRRGYLVDPASSICLSQRLSHACLSTHGRYSETANGSLNQLWFLWSLPSRYLDNCGNSRANTCRRAPTSGDACIYQTKTNPGSPGGFGDSR